MSVDYTRWIETAERIYKATHPWPILLKHRPKEWQDALFLAETYLEEEANGNE